MELTTLELLLIAPLTSHIIKSKTAPKKLKIAMNAVRERMVQALAEIDDKEIEAAGEDLKNLDPRLNNHVDTLIYGIRFARSLRNFE